MKVGGGLNYVVGPMGSGKSLYGVRRIVQSVLSGQYAVTNVQLYDDAPERIAHHLARTSKKKRALVERKVRAHYIYETDLAEAMRYRLPGRGEARGVFVWDETHNDLNNRAWQKDDRGALLEWATQLRKLGYVGYLLSQHQENTDAQLRRVSNHIIRLQNQREQTRLLGVRVTPWPLFLAVWVPTHLALSGPVKPAKVERYFLGWHRHLYDTHGLYHGLAGESDDAYVIRLPAGGRPRQVGAAAATVDAPDALLPTAVEEERPGRVIPSSVGVVSPRGTDKPSRSRQGVSLAGRSEA
jgi:Zonular occludens toxin (Zot)